MQLIKPKSWKEVKAIQTTILNNIGDLVGRTQAEARGILGFISDFSDGSGVIEACIEKYPQFVPHVKKLREYIVQLDLCYKCINNNVWLKSQPEWNEKFTDNDDDDSNDNKGSSSGGKSRSIVSLFSTIETEINVLAAVNLEVNLVMDTTYKLQHQQNKYFNKTAIKDLARNLAKSQTKTQAQVEQIIQQKNKGSMSM